MGQVFLLRNDRGVHVVVGEVGEEGAFPVRGDELLRFAGEITGGVFATGLRAPAGRAPGGISIGIMILFEPLPVRTEGLRAKVPLARVEGRVSSIAERFRNGDFLEGELVAVPGSD